MMPASSRIINISLLLEHGYAGQANYSASKVDLLIYQSIAKELGSRNVLVNCAARATLEVQ